MRRYGLEIQLAMYGQRLTGAHHWEWPVGVEEWRQRAQAALAEGPWGYLEGGAGSEATIGSNRAAFARWHIRPRYLRNVEDRDLSVELFGRRVPMPVLLAPIGVQSILHAEAELATARAAARHQVPFILSTVSSVPLETVAAAMGDAPRWFQLYPGRDPQVIQSFLDRAAGHGYTAIVVTVDTTMLGWRVRDLRHLYLPFLDGEGVANFFTDPVFRSRLARPPEEDPASAVQQFLATYVNPAFTWDDLRRIRRGTRLPLLVKGLTHPEDVRQAFDSGADGVVLSNHGGRQVDGAVAPLDVLPSVRQAVGDDAIILLDSGIRHAADVLKAIALGANAVLLGRPYAYGLAVGGEAGVDEVLRQWQAELDLQLGLSGYTRVADIGPDYVASALPMQ
jgi:lactate 2-monooxygenase